MAVIMHHAGMKALTQVSVTEAAELKKAGWVELTEDQFRSLKKHAAEAPAAPAEEVKIEAQKRMGRPRKVE